MSDRIPVGDFKYYDDENDTNYIQKHFNWAISGELAQYILSSQDKIENEGYFYECDLEYPKELHSYHHDLPLCPVHEERINGKLCATLHPKRNVVLHYKLLDCYLRHGLKLTKIHRIISFREKRIYDDWVKLKVKNRMNARKIGNTFISDKEKNECIAVFGKSIENKKNHLDVKVATNEKQCLRYNSDPLIENIKIINENLVMYLMKKKGFIENKPIFLGATILALAKVQYYDLYYNHIKRYYGNDVRFIYGDTDSFVLEINKPRKDVEEDFNGVLHEVIDYNKTGELGKLKIEDWP